MMEEGRLLKHRYRLGERLGAGRTCAVHRGFDTLLEQEVALRIPHEHLWSDNGFRNAFYEAARRALKMAHPNLVQVHDFGQEEEMPFVVEELVRGGTLQSQLSGRGRMSTRGFLHFAIEVLDVLDYLHDNGWAHGNLNERNVMLLEGSRQLKISDAGFPQEWPPEVTEEDKEQEQEEDLLALGMIFYHALEGKRLEPALLLDQAGPLPQIEMGDHVPPQIAALVMRSMARGENVRFASPAEMLREVRAALQREEPRPADAGAGEAEVHVKRRFFRRKRSIIMIAVLVLVVLVLVLLWPLSSGWFSQDVEVPNLMGVSSQEAARVLEGAGLKMSIAGAEYRAGSTVDQVIEQDPVGGKITKLHSTVQVLLSKGSLRVPNLTGLSLEDATRAIGAAGFTLGNVEKRSLPKYKPNVVVESDPPYGAELNPGAAVNLAVSQP